MPKEGENPKALDMIWTLAAGAADQPGVLWAGTLPELAGYRLFALRLERVEPGLVDADLQLEPLP